VLLWPLALPLAVGLVAVLKRGGPVSALLWFGLLTAPIPATLMPEDYTIDRQLAVLPFAVLFATEGMRAMWSAPMSRRVGFVTLPVAVLVALIAFGYAAVSLTQRGRLSSSAPALLLAAAAIWTVGRALDRTASWRPVAAATMVLIPVVFAVFLSDYFNGYRVRSADWFGGNVRGAIEELVRLDRESPAREIRLSTDIPYIRSYWRFYLTMWDRGDLLAKTKEFDAASLDGLDFAANSYVLSAGSDPAAAGLAARPEVVRVSGASDVSGGREQFTIYRVAPRP
jgi:hypothetical protein